MTCNACLWIACNTGESLRDSRTETGRNFALNLDESTLLAAFDEHSPPSKLQALLLHGWSHRELFRMFSVHNSVLQQSPLSYLQPAEAQRRSQTPLPLELGGHCLTGHRQSPPSYWHNDILQMMSQLPLLRRDGLQ